jgi:hypothetical protein
MVDDVRRVAIEKRAELGGTWLDRLLPSKRTPVQLVRRGDGRAFVIEDGSKRAVKSGILAAALELAIGPYRDASDAELDALTDGVPAELFEDENGQVFLLLGGEVRRIRGVPVTHPIDSRKVSDVPRGGAINVADANVSRRRFTQAMSGQFQIERLRSAVKRKGVVGTTKTVASRAARSFKKSRGR